MVQLKVISGKRAGAGLVTRRFPVRVGRLPANDVTLDDPGVWDQHFRIEFRRKEGYFLTAEHAALVDVNRQPVQSTLLRNGDLVGLGSARIQFWLAEVRQGGLGIRECFTWVLLAGISLLQVALVYFLLSL